MITLNHISYSTKEIDSIFKLAIYNHCDCSFNGKAAQRFLVKKKIGPWESDSGIRDLEYSHWAIAEYIKIVESYVKERWPSSWMWTHDYWGARGLYENPGWEAPKNGGYYLGDACSHMMWFSCWQALVDYTDESLQCEGLA